MMPRVPEASDDAAAPFVPYVRSTERVAELTPLAIGLGIVLSVTFGMVNAYLGLKIGLTVSASPKIPRRRTSLTFQTGSQSPRSV